jgi:hypothetical protein
MSHNWKIIRKKLYGTLASSGRGMLGIAMYDEHGNRTIEPLDATRFFVTFESQDPEIENFTVLVAIRDEGQLSHVDMKSPELDNEEDFEMILGLLGVIRKSVGEKEGIKINWTKFNGSIDPREEAVNNIQEGRDISKMSGTTKSSFQRIGNARLIVRHTDIVNEEKHGARTRHIRALFVENRLGERFAYPHLHLSGARAFARHISQGGSNHDDISKKIFALSEDYIALRKVSSLLRSHNNVEPIWTEAVRHGMQDINSSLKGMQGPKNYVVVSQKLLGEGSGVIDEGAIIRLHRDMADRCDVPQDGGVYSDLGVAARYITGMPRMTKPMVFGWIRRPNVTMHTQPEVQNRLHGQIMELASACSNQEVAEKLCAIAEMIKTGQMPGGSDLDLVKEAFASGLQHHDEMPVPLQEEAELDEFFSSFKLESIFSPSIDVKRPNNTLIGMEDSTDNAQVKESNSDISSLPDDCQSTPVSTTDDVREISRLKNLAGI